MMAGDAPEPGFTGPHALGELVHPAAGSGEGFPDLHFRDLVKYKQIGVIDVKRPQAGLHLRNNGVQRMIHFVDHEQVLALAPEGGADDFLAVTLLITGSGVDEVHTEIHRPVEGIDALLERHVPIGNIADADQRSIKSRFT